MSFAKGLAKAKKRLGAMTGFGTAKRTEKALGGAANRTIARIRGGKASDHGTRRLHKLLSVHTDAHKRAKTSKKIIGGSAAGLGATAVGVAVHKYRKNTQGQS